MSHTHDFGSSRSKDLNGVITWIVVGGMAAILAVGTLWELVAEHRTIAQSTADTNLAAIVGPPCPSLSRAAFQQQLTVHGGQPLPYVFDFNGATFGRYFGYADCTVAEAKGSLGLGTYDVCQFTSPSVLYVKTSRGEFFFQPGVGQKATILTPDGSARCVMAAPAED